MLEAVAKRIVAHAAYFAGAHLAMPVSARNCRDGRRRPRTRRRRLVGPHQRNYRYYMRRLSLKVARIGNSRGVRIPATTLDRYGIGDVVVMEERTDGILLRPEGAHTAKLSWEQTANEMATSGEDWSEWDSTVADALDAVPWAPKPPVRHNPQKAARRRQGM